MNPSDQLFQAILHGRTADVSQLLDQHAELINISTPSGVPAVLFAMYNDQPLIVKTFLEHGAQVDIFTASALGIMGKLRNLLEQQPGLANALSVDGYTPLGLAAFFGREDAVDLLLKYKAEVNMPAINPMRVMPLHSAAAGQHLNIARRLLEHGAQVNASQAGGFTALHAAAQNGQLEMVKILLEYGADPHALADDGSDALKYAQQSGEAGVIAAIKRALGAE
ncbi:MAG: ankyrin repeat domain-containing protein [Anaerolineae bacterium]|nr:ankyrin repeat domain-containing protein [Anaerolineae bacterium]